MHVYFAGDAPEVYPDYFDPFTGQIFSDLFFGTEPTVVYHLREATGWPPVHKHSGRQRLTETYLRRERRGRQAVRPTQ